MATIFLSDPDQMRKLHKAHSIDAPNQIFIHLAVLSANQKQESSMASLFFVLLGQMRKLYKGPSIDTPYNIIPFGQAVSEKKIFNVLANQKEQFSTAAMFFVPSG